MNQPDRPQVPTPSERKPGRSFTDPRRPLGEDLIERSDPHASGDPEEGVYGRSHEHPATGHGVAERAKGVAVLRKAEELMATGNPAGDTDEGRRRALELACGRCGVRLKDYERICAMDEEIASLHAAVMLSAASGG